MKKLYLSAIAALLLVTGCATTNKEAEEENKEPEAMEVEEETEIETDEGESSGGM